MLIRIDPWFITCYNLMHVKHFIILFEGLFTLINTSIFCQIMWEQIYNNILQFGVVADMSTIDTVTTLVADIVSSFNCMSPQQEFWVCNSR